MISSQLILAIAGLLAVSRCSLIQLSNEINRRFQDDPPTLALTGAVFTSKWIEGTNKVQIIELIVNNTDTTNWLTTADNLKITVSSSSLQVVQIGTLRRLRPGDSAKVQIGVQNIDGVTPGESCTGTVHAMWGTTPQSITQTISGSCGIGNYLQSSASLNKHLTPDWYNNAKFGIFIHWGIYSAPAFGNSGNRENYAEWYWARMNDPADKTLTYQYHNVTYGTNFNYDDFFSNFTASNFSAQTWVDVIADSGAQYLVPVSKHHDGFALFNFSNSISNRSSIHYGPGRDFIKEILDAAKTYQPHLRRGTYFSMPEWYNPYFKKYGVSYWPGGPPTNPYTGVAIPYTGLVNVSDFVLDIQLPQMNELAYTYETEIMWCDINVANNATIFAANWLNWAAARGRQVTFNNRCGTKLDLLGDFDTPEYTTFATTVDRKWETNRGIDPFSFGYNYKTADSKYLTSNGIVQSLVDSISKNGNFLLDIGPKNDGTIPDIVVENLRGAGVWIKAHTESIFNTHYWYKTPGNGTIRYTTTKDAFYIHAISTPANNFTISDPIPYLPGDNVTVIGGSLAGTPVDVIDDGNGTYTFILSEAIIAADQFVWTFKIQYM